MSGMLDLLLQAAADAGCTDNPSLREKLLEATESGRPLITAVIDSQLVDERVFFLHLSNQLHMPYFPDGPELHPEEHAFQFPPRIALRHQVIFASAEAGQPGWVLTCDPFDLSCRQLVRHALDQPYRWALSTRRHIRDELRICYGVGADTFEEIVEGRDVEDVLATLKQETTVLDEEDSDASVVKFLNQIIREALNERATDIHIEPLENDLRIRSRVDGVLREIPVPPKIKLLQASLISRIKIMSHLDIAEHRMPQDGRINLELEGKPIDVRVAIIPSVVGEAVSLRLLGQERFDFAKLGLEPSSEKIIHKLIEAPNGIILLTGPTGCGKSSTLYTFLTYLNTKERRIVTVEDPVEQKLPGIVQIAVKPEIQLTFAAGLRSILRADPNIVMIGEMRDYETAETAIRAALTGHLVFSTLHTNDAIGGITRLVDMGIEPFLVNASVRGFIAQRLIRVLCPKCKTKATHSLEYLTQIGFPLEHADKLYKPVGCDHCRMTGYYGRTAIHEICTMTEELQEMVALGKPPTQLRVVAIEQGMTPLRQAGWKKVIAGLTPVEEVLRVTAAEHAPDKAVTV